MSVEAVYYWFCLYSVVMQQIVFVIGCTSNTYNSQTIRHKVGLEPSGIRTNIADGGELPLSRRFTDPNMSIIYDTHDQSHRRRQPSSRKIGLPY